MLTEIFPAIEARRAEFPLKDGTLSRALLWVDGHATRRQTHIWKEAYKKGIDVHIFPAHTSHLLQPLDRCPFSVLKRFFPPTSIFFLRGLINMEMKPGLRVWESHFVPWVKKLEIIIDGSINMKNILGGFEKAGLHPLHKEIVTDDLPNKAPIWIGEKVC
jgi:hypothetical protein